MVIGVSNDLKDIVSPVTYNQATTKLAFPSNETSKDTLSII